MYEQLYKIYEKKGDYKNSFFYLKNFKLLNDSIFNEKNLRKTTEQEYIYQFDTERQLIERQNQEKEAIAKAKEKLNTIIIAILAIGICLVTLLLVFLYRSYRQKHHFNNLLEKQKEEIEEKNSQLKEFNEGKDKFFSILAHDLKSSFNSILGFSDLLSSPSTTYTADEIQKMSSAIHTSAQNTYKLLENLLTWSKTNVGVVGFKPVQFNLDELIDGNKPDWTAMAVQKNIEIECKYLNNCTIFADREMINTILRNLVTNAIKFTPVGGRIEITTGLNNDGTQITVADTGIGMTQEEIDDLFIVGKISTRPGTHNEMGTGLGLLICKEFVDRHNGQIWIESEPERGSKFTFMIPKNGI